MAEKDKKPEIPKHIRKYIESIGGTIVGDPFKGTYQRPKEEPPAPRDRFSTAYLNLIHTLQQTSRRQQHSSPAAAENILSEEEKNGIVTLEGKKVNITEYPLEISKADELDEAGQALIQHYERTLESKLKSVFGTSASIEAREYFCNGILTNALFETEEAAVDLAVHLKLSTPLDSPLQSIIFIAGSIRKAAYQVADLEYNLKGSGLLYVVKDGRILVHEVRKITG